MAKHSLDGYYISVEEAKVDKRDKSISVIQAMNYTLYGITEKNLLSNECEIIGNYIKELSRVLTGEERQTLKKYLHLYGNSKVSWRATKRLRVWSIIDLTVRSYLLAVESRANTNHKDYGYIQQSLHMIENNFISSCNLTDLISKIKGCLSLIDESEDGLILKKKMVSLEGLIRVNINSDLDYFSCADIVGISLDYSEGDARILKLVETLLGKIVKLNSIEFAQQLASEMTQCARQSNAIRHKGKEGLSTQDRT